MSVRDLTCRLCGENTQGVRVVHPRDLHSAIADTKQENIALKEPRAYW